MTAIIFAPESFVANSMLPSMSGFSILPATRQLKMSPRPRSKMISAGARESMHPRITAAGDNKFKVEGDLTIKGITKPVTLDAELLGVAPFGIGGKTMGKKAGFVATATINRKDFNILWNRALDNGGMLLGDDVAITLDVELDKDMPKPEEAAKPADAAKPTASGDKK